MKGVTFGTYHTNEEWGLLLQSQEIQSPAPKKMQIDLDGSDGMLDLTDTFGGVKYSNRSLLFQFAKKEISMSEYLALYSKVQNAIHGQKLHIVLDDDPNYYYVGRVTVDEWKSDKNLGTVVIGVDAEPFKYDGISSLDDWEWDPFDFENDIVNELNELTVSGSLDIIITGKKKTVCPEIISSAAMQLIFEGNSYPIVAGSNKVYQFTIKEGDNPVRFVGNGTVSIDYRGGSL